MRVFSTFSGIGGFEIGIHNALVRHQDQGVQRRRRSARNTSGPGKQLPELNLERLSFVGYSEINEPAIGVYEKHFEGVKNYGDITTINADRLPDFECLVGGFPCQAFSIAGKRKGFDDTRGTLFFDLARILRAKRPQLFVFENVKGLLSHDNGQTFRVIISTIDELGYDAQWQVINSKNHGVPQNRERIYIVGHLRGSPRPKVFPLAADPEADIVLPTLTARYWGAQANGGYISHQSPKVGTYRTHKDGQGFREVKEGISPTIPARARQDGSGQPVILVPEATKKGYAEATVGDAINLNQLKSKTRRGRVSKVSPTVDTGAGHSLHTLTSDVRVRRLTPIECERLQGFPDDWTKYNAQGEQVSDSQRYKMCGNAVTTNAVQAVFEKIYESIDKV